MSLCHEFYDVYEIKLRVWVFWYCFIENLTPEIWIWWLYTLYILVMVPISMLLEIIYCVYKWPYVVHCFKWLVCVGVWFGYICCCCVRKIVPESAILAQASQARLGEICRDSITSFARASRSGGGS